MNKNLLKYFRYYHGEEECPFEIDDVRRDFWFGESVMYSSCLDESFDSWVKNGQELLANLTQDKRKFAEQFTPEEFAVVLYIEALYSKHCPYDDMGWIYEY